MCTVVPALYGLILFPFFLIGHALFLGHIGGTGVRVSETQLPELYQRVVKLSERLKLPEVPEVYVIQAGGILNALATKLFSRRYIILYSTLIDSCHTDDEVDFVVAHELAHHAAGHLSMHLFTAPVRLVPLLGPAYSRACEYTCDRAGLFAVGNLEVSQRALAVLAGGTKTSAQLDLGLFAQQQHNAGEFWPAVAELSSTHPFLSKRVAMLASWHAQQSGLSGVEFAPPARPVIAYVLGIFVGQQAFTLLAFVYVFGILAAIAIPNFIKFQERARQLGGPAQVQPAQVPETDDTGE